jgi:hypothetical protein
LKNIFTTFEKSLDIKIAVGLEEIKN